MLPLTPFLICLIFTQLYDLILEITMFSCFQTYYPHGNNFELGYLSLGASIGVSCWLAAVGMPLLMLICVYAHINCGGIRHNMQDEAGGLAENPEDNVAHSGKSWDVNDYGGG